TLIDLLHRLAGFAPARRRAAATRLMGNGQSDAVIECRGQESGLAQSRVADNGDSLLVDILVGDEVIGAAVQAPGPGTDGSAAIRAGLSGLGPVGANAIAGAVVIGLDVAAVEGGHCVTAFDGLLQGPNIYLRAAARLGCSV